MERIKVLLQHVIDSAKIRGLDDIEISARVLLGSIEKECVHEFSDACIAFSEKKVMERMMSEN